MNSPSYKRWAIIPLVLLCTTCVYGYPLIAECLGGRSFAHAYDWDGDGWGVPFLRSGLFAAVAVAIHVPAGFFGAVAFRRVSPAVESLLVLLLAPVLMGSIGVGFVWKLNVMNLTCLSDLIADRAFFPTWGLMLLVQTWQYLPLFAYMFWLRLQSVDSNTQDFASACQLNWAERIRDVYWPHCRNLAAFLALFGTIQGLQEFSKFHLVLRASSGTATELASHRLLRYYHYYAPVNPSLATSETLAYSAIFVILAAICTVIVVLAVTNVTALCARGVLGLRRLERLGATWLSDIVGGTFIILTIAPAIILVRYTFRGHFIEFAQFARSCVLTLLAVGLVMTLAILFGISSRIVWPKLLQAFNRRSLLFFVAICSLNLLPPIAIAFCGYHWLATLNLGLRDPLYATLLWLVGQAILAFPILACFVQYNHFRVRNAEIHLQQACGASFREVAVYSFLARFRIEYALVALFGFSVIWNEATLNSIMSGLSRHLPSIAVELTRRVDGKASSYYEAANLIVVSLIPIVVGIVLWKRSENRTHPGPWRK